MPLRILFTALLLGLGSGGASAQDTPAPQVVCTIQGCGEIVIPKPRYSDASAFSVQQVWTVVNDILGVSGLLPNFQVVETFEVGNAAAVIIEGERYLAFNPDWIAQYKSDTNAHWQLYGIMAHEVGHHLQGHTITGTGSHPPTELEADEYAGFTLSALGADLVEAQSLWATLPKSGSVTHPPRHQRLAAVERGWLRRQDQTPQTARPASQTPSEPIAAPPSWALNTCTSTFVAGHSANFCVSSVLPGQGTNSYGPQNALDNRTDTAWVEGASGQGIGEAFILVFDQQVQLNSLKIKNGYGKSARTFSRNSRVRNLRATTSDDQEMAITLMDTSDWQATNALAKFGKIHWIMFEIDAVFPGSHYRDTAITELAFE